MNKRQVSFFSHRWLPIPGVAVGLLLLWLGALLLPGAAVQADGAILRVPADYATIQAAIDAAQEGDEIRILGGPDFEHPVNYLERLTITKSLHLSGGWADNYSEQSFGNHPTILDAEEGGRAITVLGPVSTTIVTIQYLAILNGDATGLGGWQRDASLPSFPGDYDTPGDALTETVSLAEIAPEVAPLAVSERQARVTALPALQRAAAAMESVGGSPLAPSQVQGVEVVDCGGAIYSSNASLHLINTVIADSVASRTRTGYGGGVCIVTAPPGGVVLQNNSIKRNQGAMSGEGGGGGLFLADAPGALLTGNEIKDNAAAQGLRGAGGGVYAATVQLVFLQNGVYDNIASIGGDGSGGGALLQAPAAVVMSNTIGNNLAAGGGLGLGGGLMLLNAEAGTVVGNHFSDNLASGGGRGVGGGLLLADAADLRVEANTFTGNTAGSAPNLRGTGGGAYARNTDNIIVRGNTFDRNLSSLYASGLGGGLYLYQVTGATLQANRFTRNWGAIYAPGGAGGGGLGLGEVNRMTATDNDFESNAAVLYTGGRASGHGGGAYAVVVHDSLIATNIFTNNVGSWEGAGVGGALATSPDTNNQDTERLVVADNLLLSNMATLGKDSAHGGAIDFRAVDSQIVRNHFEANRLCLDDHCRGGAGAAVYVHGFLLCRKITVDGNAFVDSYTTASDTEQVGGVLTVFNVDTYTITNNLMAGDVGFGDSALVLAVGSELVPDEPSQSWVVNNTIVGNSLLPGISVNAGFADASLFIINNLLVSHTVGITISAGSEAQINVAYTLFDGNGQDIGGDGVYTVTHSLSGAPAFVDPANGDFHLLPTSAAIDAGDPAGIPPAPPVDIEDFPRPFGPRVDIGAYEWHGTQLFLPVIARQTPVLVGWAVGQDRNNAAVIVGTTDGGHTWQVQKSSPGWAGLDAGDISAVDEQTAWAALVSAPGTLRDAIVHTTDGGANWVTQMLPAGVTGGVKSIKGLSRSEAWATSMSGVILHTTDGGASWVIAPNATTPITRVNRMDASGQRVWIADSDDQGAVVFSHDAGLTWQVAHLDNAGQPDTPLTVHAASSQVVWSSGTESLTFYRSLDGGGDWAKVISVGGFDHLDDICASSAEHVWGVTNGGGMDGRIKRVVAPAVGDPQAFDVTPEALHGYMPGGVTCLDQTVAWVVGQQGPAPDPAKPDGVILYTTDGANWTQATAPADVHFWKISMAGARR